MESASPPISFDELSELAQQQGLTCLASIPLPQQMGLEGLEQMLRDGVGDMVWIEHQKDLRQEPPRLL